MEPHGQQPHRPPPGKAEILASAKVIAEATRGDGKERMDKGKVAGAAADLLGAASHYGKLEGKGVGKLVDKAEDYLRQYNSSHAPSPPAAVAGAGAPPKHSEAGAGGGGGGGGGYGDYLKMAEGLLKKQSGGTGGGGGDSASAGSTGGGGGGFGDYLKMAEGLMKKR